jgi:hypothetical protein
MLSKDHKKSQENFLHLWPEDQLELL